MSDSKGRLFVVSAPSGCGKGTVLSEVFKNRDVFYSVSCTRKSSFLPTENSSFISLRNCEM